MHQLLTDVRSGIRMLVKYPTLSIVAVLTLGLGIGLSTTVFCVVNGGLFKGLPFPNADRIVSLVATNPSQNAPRLPIRVQDIAVFEQRQSSFERLGAFGFSPVNLANEEGRPERFSGGLLTVGAFESLGVRPMLGRGFRDEDARPGAEPVILLGYRLWRERFNGSPDIVGRAIRVNGSPHAVIGVMPEKFAFPIREELWMPLTIDPLAKARAEGPFFQLIGRLKPGISVAQARTQAVTIAAQSRGSFRRRTAGSAPT